MDIDFKDQWAEATGCDASKYTFRISQRPILTTDRMTNSLMYNLKGFHPIVLIPNHLTFVEWSISIPSSEASVQLRSTTLLWPSVRDYINRPSSVITPFSIITSLSRQIFCWDESSFIRLRTGLEVTQSSPFRWKRRCPQILIIV